MTCRYVGRARRRRASKVEIKDMRRFPIAIAAFLASLSIIPDHARASAASPFAGCVALTFDDGPDPTLTPQVLEVLEQAHVPATFFVLGQRVRLAPEIVRRKSADGDEIGNHTFDHRLLLSLVQAQVLDEIALTDKAVIAATGLRPTLIRPPYGMWSESV